MNKKKAPQGQLSWLQPEADQLSWLDIVEPVQIDEDDLSYTDKDFIPNAQYPHMPEYIVVGHASWANGDNSPEDLERLAEALLNNPTTFRDNKKDVYKYLPITTAIINSKVWVAYQFDRKLVRYIPHPSEAPDEDG